MSERMEPEIQPLEFGQQSEPEGLDVQGEIVFESENPTDIEMGLLASIDRRCPLLAEPRKTVLNSDKGKIAEIDQIREFETPEPEHPDLWLIVDFDDVLNHTTEENKEFQEILSGETAIPVEKLKKLYEAAKIETPEGKKVFRFSEFTKLVKTETGDSGSIDVAVKKVDHKKYVDQAVKRALIASRFGQNIGFSYSSPTTVRVSILTYGDVKYQRARIEASGISEVADEIIYTEGSKREVIEGMLARDYPETNLVQLAMGKQTDAPFTITFDDSPEQVRDLSGLREPQEYLNVRFRHPQAKRFRKKTPKGKEVVVAEETSSNQAAFDMFTIAMMATSPESKQILSPNSIYDYQKDRKERERILKSWGYNLDKKDDPEPEDGKTFRGPQDAWVLKKFIIGD